MSTTTLSPTEEQVAMAEGLAVDLVEIWTKMGRTYARPEWAKYAKWDESTVHELMEKTRRVSRARDSFADYTRTEVQRCITQLKRLRIQYSSTWRTHWEASLAEDERIMADCWPYERAANWMQANPGPHTLEEVFAFEKRIRGENYFKKRPRPVKLYTLSEAERWVEQYAPGRSVDELFTKEYGAGAVWYLARYYYNSLERKWVPVEGNAGE